MPSPVRIATAAEQARRAALEVPTAPLWLRFGVAVFEGLSAMGNVRERPASVKGRVTIIDTTATEVRSKPHAG